ncbi:hypothetical protein GCM10022198_20240 [Klugiella xanthotipulae]
MRRETGPNSPADAIQSTSSLTRLSGFAPDSTYIALRMTVASGTPSAPTFARTTGFLGWAVTSTTVSPLTT